MRGRGRDLAAAGMRVAPIIALGIAIAVAMWFGVAPVAFAVSESHRPPTDARALIALSIAANVIVLCALLVGASANRRRSSGR